MGQGHRLGRREERQGHPPLPPPWLCDTLKTWISGGGKLWEQFPRKWPGRVLQLDLADASVAYEVAGPLGPLFFDFHALRHWFVTTTARLPGMDLKTLMEVARLSDPRLAMNVYTHAEEERKKAAAEALPRPGQDKPRRTDGDTDSVQT